MVLAKALEQTGGGRDEKIVLFDLQMPKYAFLSQLVTTFISSILFCPRLFWCSSFAVFGFIALFVYSLYFWVFSVHC